MPAELGYLEEVGLRLPVPEFRGDDLSFVITVRSITPRRGAPMPDPFRALLERGEINGRQYHGLARARAWQH